MGFVYDLRAKAVEDMFSTAYGAQLGLMLGLGLGTPQAADLRWLLDQYHVQDAAQHHVLVGVGQQGREL